MCKLQNPLPIRQVPASTLGTRAIEGKKVEGKFGLFKVLLVDELHAKVVLVVFH